MDTAVLLEERIRAVVDQLATLQRERDRLTTENETLKSHIDVLTEENTKAQRLFAEYKQLRHTHVQVTTKVEKALQRLDSLHQISQMTL